MANPSAFGLGLLVLSAIGTIGAFVTLILLAAEWPWEYVDINNAGAGVDNSYWQWIYVAPALMMVVGVLGLLLGYNLWKNKGTQQSRRSMTVIFAILTMVLICVAAACFGAWIMRMHIFEHAAETTLNTNNCTSDGEFQTSTACGEKTDTNEIYLGYKLTQYYDPVLGVMIVSLLMLLLAGVVALALFLVPLHNTPAPQPAYDYPAPAPPMARAPPMGPMPRGYPRRY